MFGSDAENPFKKRRAQFLKDQQNYEAEAEESKRNVEQNRLKIIRVEKENETENIAFKCISVAIAEMKVAVGRVSMPSVSVSLFEEDLKKDCTNLLGEIRSMSSFSVPKGTAAVSYTHLTLPTKRIV